MIVRLGTVAVGVSLVGCVGSAAQHEILGDRAYAEDRFGDALVEYRLALVQRSDPELHAKTAAAAVHTGELMSAVEQYVALAGSANDVAVADGADGLERVARAALAIGDRDALAAALDGLRGLAPKRALGSFAREVASQVADEPASEEVLSVLEYAAAAAPDARLQDSLVYKYSLVLEELGRCEEAVPVLESLLRRGREPAVLDSAHQHLGFCSLTLGNESLDEGLPLSAEAWFQRAVAGAANTTYGRAAYLGLGDVLLARGDFPGAAAAYESALVGGEIDDSISVAAAARLSIVQRAGTGIP
ncbi:MAG: hypothetical protein ACE5HT_00595 [Gemmatimonadales bacterium]